jgi:hypothetical protein
MFGAKEERFWQQEMVVGQKVRRLQRVRLTKRSPSDRMCNWQHRNALQARARKPIDKNPPLAQQHNGVRLLDSVTSCRTGSSSRLHASV